MMSLRRWARRSARRRAPPVPIAEDSSWVATPQLPFIDEPRHQPVPAPPASLGATLRENRAANHNSMSQRPDHDDAEAGGEGAGGEGGVASEAVPAKPLKKRKKLLSGLSTNEVSWPLSAAR